MSQIFTTQDLSTFQRLNSFHLILFDHCVQIQASSNSRAVLCIPVELRIGKIGLTVDVKTSRVFSEFKAQDSPTSSTGSIIYKF